MSHIWAQAYSGSDLKKEALAPGEGSCSHCYHYSILMGLLHSVCDLCWIPLEFPMNFYIFTSSPQLSTPCKFHCASTYHSSSINILNKTNLIGDVWGTPLFVWVLIDYWVIILTFYWFMTALFFVSTCNYIVSLIAYWEGHGYKVWINFSLLILLHLLFCRPASR